MTICPVDKRSAANARTGRPGWGRIKPAVLRQGELVKCLYYEKPRGNDEYGLKRHRKIFNDFPGPKREYIRIALYKKTNEIEL